MKLRTILFSLAAVGFCTGAAAQAPIVIKFSHVVAADTPKGKASEFFKKRAEELSKGKVKVEVYANSALYKDKEELEALQLGAVQMLAPSLAKFGPLGVKEFEVFDLPYIFDDYTELHRVTQGPVGAGILLQPSGLAVLHRLGLLAEPLAAAHEMRGSVSIEAQRQSPAWQFLQRMAAVVVRESGF